MGAFIGRTVSLRLGARLSSSGEFVEGRDPHRRYGAPVFWGNGFALGPKASSLRRQTKFGAHRLITASVVDNLGVGTHWGHRAIRTTQRQAHFVPCARPVASKLHPMGAAEDKKAQGARLRSAREDMGFEDATAGARHLKANRDTYIQHENGTRSFKGVVKKYADRLGVTPEWLMWGTGERRFARDGDTRSIPIVSWVSAGRMADPDFDPSSDGETFEISGLGDGDYFATRVRGDSMSRIAADGALIVVNKSETDLVRGHRYIFSRRGETTFKRFADNPTRLEPESLNPENEPIFPKPDERWDVIGRVRLVINEI